jgi:hypothetical protein
VLRVTSTGPWAECRIIGALSFNTTSKTQEPLRKSESKDLAAQVGSILLPPKTFQGEQSSDASLYIVPDHSYLFRRQILGSRSGQSSRLSPGTLGHLSPQPMVMSNGVSRRDLGSSG